MSGAVEEEGDRVTDQDTRPDDAKGGGLLKEIGIIVGSALVLSILVRTFLFQAFYVPSESMEDTLQISDRIIASKITTHFAGVNRGDIVVFRDPGGWLPDPVQPSGAGGLVREALTFIGLLPSNTGQDLVKRVIGVAGDHVQCCDARGRIVLNGVALNESAYVKPGDPTDQVTFDVIVPDGTVFVMGDNRANSRDSRYHLEFDNGGVPVDNVVGRVVVVVWPLSAIRTLGTPEVLENPKIEAGASPQPSPSG